MGRENARAILRGGPEPVLRVIAFPEAALGVRLREAETVTFERRVRRRRDHDGEDGEREDLADAPSLPAVANGMAITPGEMDDASRGDHRCAGDCPPIADEEPSRALSEESQVCRATVGVGPREPVPHREEVERD